MKDHKIQYVTPAPLSQGVLDAIERSQLCEQEFKRQMMGDSNLTSEQTRYTTSWLMNTVTFPLRGET